VGQSGRGGERDVAVEDHQPWFRRHCGCAWAGEGISSRSDRFPGNRTVRPPSRSRHGGCRDGAGTPAGPGLRPRVWILNTGGPGRGICARAGDGRTMAAGSSRAGGEQRGALPDPFSPLRILCISAI